MKYIVVGPTIINDIVFFDKSEKKEILGGSVYCLAGIKLWCDDCLYISNVGNDFDRYYGDWMRSNKLTTKGLKYILPHTWYTTLTYGETGLHDETSIYGEAEEALLNKIDIIKADQIDEMCDTDTKGIYIEANEINPIWDNLDVIRSKCNVKIMWEIPTSAALDPSRKDKVLKTIKKTDIYSLNLPEALKLFNVDTEQDAINAIIALNKPCFFRVGKRGSYMIKDGHEFFGPSLTVGEIIDPTGCGNASTAAALYGWCENLPPKTTACLANISAAFNLLQYGPYPAVTPEIRKKAHDLLEKVSQ